MIIRKITLNMVYAVIATDSVAARGLVNGWCLPRSGRRDILSVTTTAFIFIGVILRIIVLIYLNSIFMKALKDFKDERLSKREMGNVVGGTWFSCVVYEGDTPSYTYHYDFASTAEMYEWIQMILNDGKNAVCKPYEDTFERGTDVAF